MEHNIKNLFNKNEFEKKKLPAFHIEEFTKKIEGVSFQKKKQVPSDKNKIVAILILLIFGISIYFTFSKEEKPVRESLFLTEVKKIKKEYEENINEEWQKFIKITNDTVLINKYKKKLDRSTTDYEILTKNLKDNPKNILILETLIHNLQQRLQLLKDIQEHINELNQKNKRHETIYL